MPAATPAYISTGCNRFPHVADVGPDGTVAYGAGAYVALWDSAVRSHRFPSFPACGVRARVS